jgi:DNA polymerase (family 10)
VLATIRGDLREASMLAEGAAMVRARGIASDVDLGPLVDPSTPFEGDRQLYQRFQHMYEAGAWVLLESAIADLPADLRWLFESGAVTVEQLGAIYRELGPTSGAELGAAVARGAIQSIPGLDSAVEAAVAAALPALRKTIPRIPLGRAVATIDPILERLRALHGIEWALPSGSLRRGQDFVGDLEIVAAAGDPAVAIEDLTHLPDAGRILHQSERRLYLLLERVQVGIRFPHPDAAGSILLRWTGSVNHVKALEQIARERNVDLFAPAATENDVYARLDLPFIPPEIRDGGDEIQAARSGTLPALITRADIRGDLHMHSTWSDGRDSIEAMVNGCRALGYEYLAITDHSPRSAASRNLSVEGVKRQADEIAGIRERYPDITILHGCEVDILPDGRLDFADRILQQFDIVLASLHEDAGHAPEVLERRYFAAMKHPLVSVITHPTNRLIPYRRGYDLNYDRIFAAAVETGTVVEIDGAPAHLDLDGALARRAIAAGATVVIDSDCHRADALGRQMELGLTTARRGWVEARHVLNSRPLAELRAVIARKRGG